MDNESIPEIDVMGIFKKIGHYILEAFTLFGKVLVIIGTYLFKLIKGGFKKADKI